MATLVSQAPASKRAQRALARAAGDRRVLAGAAAAAGAALVAGVARELGRDGESDGAGPSRAYRIKRGEKPVDAVTRIARGRLDDALERLDEGFDGTIGAAVHETRKDLKKTRAVLRLVRDRIGEETYRCENARFRDVGRTLSGARDVEAGVETLDALAERYGDELPPSFRALREGLEQERKRLVAAQGDDGSDIRGLAAQAAEEITARRAAIEEWSFTKSGWKLVAPGLKRTYKRGRLRFNDTLRDPSPENVHEWRKRVKDLWYQLRLLSGSWPEVLGKMSDQAHELADLLGDHHDLTVLAQRVQSRIDPAPDVDEESSAIVGVLEARQEELLEAAVPIGERLYADPPKVFVKRLRAYWRAWRPD